ncbi:transposable element Tc3 transposase [Trichonephila clavipes]|nr:transposable element Tc3 transposase [Trichonephila clavipes]
MTLADCRRPLFACRMIYRSSPAVIVLWRSPPTFLTPVPVVWNASQTRETTLSFVDSELCSYTGDGTPLLQLSDHSSTCEVIQDDTDDIPLTGISKQQADETDPHSKDKKLCLTDEAHFWLNGYVNKQNRRIWSEANPQVYVETPLHPEKLFGALYGLVESFFKNDEGHNVTVNGDRYRAMITNFFIPELNNHDVQELWFQQNGATCNTARATIDLLKDTFGDRLISRFEPVNWPPRSCDLTPLDYFLWGYVKSLVYANKPQTLDHLEDNIRRVIADIRPQMLKKSSKIGRPDWTTSEPAVAVIC